MERKRTISNLKIKKEEFHDLYKKEEEKKRLPIKQTSLAAAAPNERTLHKDLVKLLHQYQNSHDFLFFHIKNDVGCSDKRRFYDPRPLGVLAGAADFCILTNHGTYFLEIKSLRGRLSDEQRAFLSSANRLGHCAMVGIGWDDILSKVKFILRNESHLGVISSARCNEKPGTVIWMDEKGRYLKRRPKKGFSIFLY